jgi:hypothetical protein
MEEVEAQQGKDVGQAWEAKDDTDVQLTWFLEFTTCWGGLQMEWRGNDEEDRERCLLGTGGLL